MKKKELSIIVLNYNTQDLLKNCLESLLKSDMNLKFEVIVVDNGSSDGTVEMVKRKYNWVRLITSEKNLGFAKGNNLAKNDVLGDYVLFLNTDTVVNEDTLSETLEYLKKHQLGAITCKVVLPNGKLDKDTRRHFITPFIGLVHLFLGLDKLFPHSKLFSQYWYGYINENQIHDVDAIQGAFFLSPKKVLDEVGWFDEDYFLDGEDIDLCWKIKNAGYRIVYYPKVQITHIKGATKGKNKKSEKYLRFGERLRYKLSGVNSMEVFYRKRLWNKYPFYINLMVIVGINTLKILRVIKYTLGI